MGHSRRLDDSGRGILRGVPAFIMPLGCAFLTYFGAALSFAPSPRCAGP